MLDQKINLLLAKKYMVESVYRSTNIEQEIDVETFKQLNGISEKFTVINAGSIRDMYDDPIRAPISEDKDYYPPIPSAREIIEEKLKDITSTRTLDAALELFCYVCNSQFFNDGNKRTATLITNMFMIKNGLEFYEN